jgi:hypothetical protein
MRQFQRRIDSVHAAIIAPNLNLRNQLYSNALRYTLLLQVRLC